LNAASKGVFAAGSRKDLPPGEKTEGVGLWRGGNIKAGIDTHRKKGIGRLFGLEKGKGGPRERTRRTQKPTGSLGRVSFYIPEGKTQKTG